MSDRHHLDPLLNPSSVALVGVSERPDSVGAWTLNTFLAGDYRGALYLVNPRYKSLAGRRCYCDLDVLPEVPEMALLNVGSARMEALVDQSIALGVKALTLFDYCTLEEDIQPNLIERLREKATDAGIAICGGSGMGFYNLDAKVHASYYLADHLVPGNISLIAHSGSVFTVLAMASPRHRFNLVVSAGTELGTSADEYLEYALQVPSTGVVAMFLETIRNPDGFAHALAQARACDIPVVICKVGRTEKSADFAKTHTGAIAGNQAAFDALLDKYGALRVDSLSELMATADLFAQGRRAGPGGLGAVLDSGGLRQLLVDQADKVGVRLAELSAPTVARIEEVLPHTLIADNPLDAAGPFTYDYETVFRHSLEAVVEEPDTAVGWFEFDATDRFNPFPPQLETAKTVGGATDKPFLVVNSCGSTLNTDIAVDLMDHGVPLINSVETALVAVRNVLSYRDNRVCKEDLDAPRAEPHMVERWKARLTPGTDLTELDALALLGDFGIPTVECMGAKTCEQAMFAAQRIGYPVALKTAVHGIHHKTDARGVYLGVGDEDTLVSAYHDLSGRLGNAVTVAAMASPGVEVSVGMVRDPQFGPLVIVGAGGTLVEVVRDRVSTLAPFSEAHALRQIEKLGVHALLKGVRGAEHADIAALAKTVSRFSVLASSLGGHIKEMDVNPLRVNAQGVVAVDGLVIT